ncbi:MAG TPA: glycosyltransferase family 4 protein, partial [Vicinamibacterales bacterium]|nr:glycosyltransferase family 4 protein [Vicinamibacterales bacterium]
NQYARRLAEHGVPLVQVPRWISLPASDWDTKVRILDVLVLLASPLVYLLAALHLVVQRRSWSQSVTSARGWLRSQLLSGVLAADRREALGRLLLTWWHRRWRPDLLHIQGYTTNLLFAVEWAHARRLPVVYEEHQTPDPQFDWWQGFSTTVNKTAAVVAVSQRSALALKSVCGITRPIVVRPPLLPDPLAPTWTPRPRRAAGQPLTLTCVARLYVTKGLPFLLEAIAQVTSTHPNVRLTIYGDGPLRDELHAHARQLGLDADALLPGAFTSRADLARILSDTDIFVMSSVLEGQPLGLVEAMAYGCPIVATSVGGIPELVEHGVNGFLCSSGDPGCLARTIRTLIDAPVVRERVGLEARRSYERGGFQPVAVCQHLAGVYAQVLHESAALDTAAAVTRGR